MLELHCSNLKKKKYSVGCMALHILSPDLRCNLPVLEGLKMTAQRFFPSGEHGGHSIATIHSSSSIAYILSYT